MPKFSIIIPCRDEEENVDIITDNILKGCIDYNFEIIFIDDFSQDKTLEKLKVVSSQNENISFIENNIRGLGGAINLGLKNFKGNYVTIMMADSADSIEDLKQYFDLISKNKYDAVFGSRFVRGGSTKNYPKFKLFLNRVFNNVTRLLFFSNYNDFTNSFKIYNKNVIQNLFPIVSENFNIFLELPLKTISRGYKYKIIPIKYFNRTKGQPKFKINELGSKYIFTLLYCLLEKILLKKKIKPRKSLS